MRVIFDQLLLAASWQTFTKAVAGKWCELTVSDSFIMHVKFLVDWSISTLRQS